MTNPAGRCIVPLVQLASRYGRGPATRKFTRQPPYPAERARRVAWGHKWGQLVRNGLIDAGVKIK